MIKFYLGTKYDTLVEQKFLRFFDGVNWSYKIEDFKTKFLHLEYKMKDFREDGVLFNLFHLKNFKASDFFYLNDVFIKKITFDKKYTIFDNFGITIEIISYIAHCESQHDNFIFFVYTIHYYDEEYFFEDFKDKQPKIWGFGIELKRKTQNIKNYYLNNEVVRLDKIKLEDHQDKLINDIPGFEISKVENNKYIKYLQSGNGLLTDEIISTTYLIKKIENS